MRYDNSRTKYKENRKLQSDYQHIVQKYHELKDVFIELRGAQEQNGNYTGKLADIVELHEEEKETQTSLLCD